MTDSLSFFTSSSLLNCFSNLHVFSSFLRFFDCPLSFSFVWNWIQILLGEVKGIQCEKIVVSLVRWHLRMSATSYELVLTIILKGEQNSRILLQTHDFIIGCWAKFSNSILCLYLGAVSISSNYYSPIIKYHISNVCHSTVNYSNVDY